MPVNEDDEENMEDLQSCPFIARIITMEFGDIVISQSNDAFDEPIMV